MKAVNEFQRKMIDRLMESIDIYQSLEKYDLSNSLSLDTYNANIRFQKQYLSEHISSELTSISDTHKKYVRDDEDFEKSVLKVQYNSDTVIDFKVFGQGYFINKKQ